jgi:hypothetical protein
MGDRSPPATRAQGALQPHPSPSLSLSEAFCDARFQVPLDLIARALDLHTRRILRAVSRGARYFVDERVTRVAQGGAVAAPPPPLRWRNARELRLLGVALAALRPRDWINVEALGVDVADAAAVAAVAAFAPRLPRLRSLALGGRALDAGLHALAAEPWAALETLSVARLTLVGATALAVGELSAHLRHLSVFACRSSAAGMAALVRDARWAALEEVTLEGTFEPAFSGDRVVEALAAGWRSAPHLRALRLQDCLLSHRAARALGGAGWALETLDLSGNNLGARGVAALAAAPALGMRRLCLWRCGLRADALLQLAAAPWALEELVLSGNAFREADAAPALAALLARQRRLRRLALDNCLGAAALRALAAADLPALRRLSAAADAPDHRPGVLELGAEAFACLPALEVLRLSGHFLGPAGAARVASRPWARLKELHLAMTRLGAGGLAALAARAWPALERLEVWGNEVDKPSLGEARAWAPKLAHLR